MKKLYAPWRSTYAKSTYSKEENTHAGNCVFCTQFAKQDDSAHFILKRFEDCVVMLNLYPYNAGHLLILPHEHVPTLGELSVHTRARLMELTNACATIAQSVLGAEGVNVGINIGKAAGAGIPSHLHIHVLPRRTGDTNFLPLLADTRAVSFDLHEMYKMLKPHFDTLAL